MRWYTTSADFFSICVKKHTPSQHTWKGRTADCHKKCLYYHHVWDKSNILLCYIARCNHVLPLTHAAIWAWGNRVGRGGLWASGFILVVSREAAGLRTAQKSQGLWCSTAELGTGGVKDSPESSRCCIFNAVPLHHVNIYFIYGYPKL